MRTTKTIAGHRVRLERGKRYIASRPFARRGQKRFTVSIYAVALDGLREVPADAPALQLRRLSYDRSNDFLAAFNNEAQSFTGRVW